MQTIKSKPYHITTYIQNLEEYNISTQSTLVKKNHYNIWTKIFTNTMLQFNFKIMITQIDTN